MGPATVDGHCAPGFTGVREAFERNFRAHGDIGAAVTVTLEGEAVVDLWGGRADAAGTRAWEHDTLVNVYSTSKGMTALCAHLLVERGELDLDAPVVRYWPEFGQAGKQDIPVRWLLSHRAGLIAPRAPLPEGCAYDWDRVCAALAATEPWWEPGTAQGYHAVTFGYLVGEVVRRITGQSLGTFLRNEITGPLGAEVFIGTPAEEHARCADMVGRLDEARIAAQFPGVPKPPFRTLADHPLAVVMLALLSIPTGDVNSAAYRSAEIPAGNAHASAHGLATVYGALAGGTLVGPGTLEAMRRSQSLPGERDLTIDALAPAGHEHRWGLGYMLNHRGQAGPNPGAFGHGGAGGSYAFADPENRLSFAYTMNKYGGGTTGDDPRNRGLVRAVYQALAQTRRPGAGRIEERPNRAVAPAAAPPEARPPRR
ncbi:MULTISPECIES: serine hydrolase domain-containing protein [unclassified Streptomyces]|uniref:serine hydrolase domain-containing protein n=1 Tax=unclassified Streptomyces TaxID=2593676 RepID=UPI000887A654|nr:MULTISPECIES: serine hydrolase domain-containing protein [unclassified Streptomyces]PBC85720.1 CubicO group peptidase (beta-lactamase class C family) [Streptomyces sp. 2321.6]SDR07714.1 CubicO group peptidase, beta-lactamase class C family [Streptomyces sp. KS_16]SED77047.1 CubicO group peptidase, beta-lactamase class C family [Streptomyces sp. 2133.1]SNC72584.1 CubicO group peptidase, beta-lactamase class C family [Streptomyces sp. 2114.4]